MQIVRHLVIEQDDHQQKYRRPASLVEEIELFLRDTYGFFCEQRELFVGYRIWVIVGAPVAILAAGAILAALWEFTPVFNVR